MDERREHEQKQQEHKKIEHAKEEQRKDSVVIPKNAVKWVALLLVGLNVFTFLIGVFVSPALLQGRSAGGGSQAVLQAPPTPDGDGARASVKTADSASLGSTNAKVKIIEFSDFQCPFCRRFAEQTLPELKKQYIDTGKVSFEYRHFPLSIHPGAQPAAEAFECAREQNKHWEVHDVIFVKQQEQGSGTIEFSADDVKRWLNDVQGLDVAKLVQCMDSGAKRARVLGDLNDGNAAGVDGTPSFFIGSDAKGYVLIRGAQPFIAFQQVIEQELS